MADFHRGFEGVDSSTEEQLFLGFLDQVARRPPPTLSITTRTSLMGCPLSEAKQTYSDQGPNSRL